jgi:hypothetical protein
VLEAVRSLSQQKTQLHSRQHLGRTFREGNEYTIATLGDNETSGYLTFHEFLHIWLEETGRTFEIGHEDKNISVFLFELRNLLNDFLIEAEIKRRCHNAYEDNVSYTKNQDIMGQFFGGSGAKGIQVFMLGILSVALSDLYPKMKDKGGVQIFNKSIQIPGLDQVIELLHTVKTEALSPKEYEELACKICNLLTGAEMMIANGKPEFKFPERVLSFATQCENTYQQIQNLLRGRLE